MSPYQDKDKEEQLISFLLFDKMNRKYWMKRINSDIFNVSIYRYFYDIMTYLKDKNKTIGVESLKAYIEKDTENPADYIKVLESLSNQNVNIEFIVEELTDIKTRRVLFELAGHINNSLLSDEAVDGIKKKVSQTLFSLSGLSNDDKIDHALDEIDKQIEKNQSENTVPYLITGLSEWDENVPLAKERLITITAQPSVGKTTFTVDLLNRVLRKNTEVAVKFFSWDISKNDLLKNFTSNLTSITVQRINGIGVKLDKKEIEVYKKVFNQLKSMPLHIEDVPLDPEALYVSCEKFVLENPGKHCLFALDHHLNSRKRHKDIRSDVKELAETCKSVAKNLQTTFLLLAQQRRFDKLIGPGNIEDSVPTKYRIMESASVEQESDVIAGLWRPIMYQGLEQLPETHEMKVIIDKHRFGQLNTLNFMYTPKYGTLDNLYSNSLRGNEDPLPF